MDIIPNETMTVHEPEEFAYEQWETTRGLKRAEGVIRLDRNEQYMDVLPTHHGQNLLDILKEKTESGEQIRLLDIGGGAGLLALDLRGIYSPQQLDIQIIGHPKDTQEYLSDVNRGVIRGPTEQELREKQIGFHFIDFSNLDPGDLETLGRFDVITACYSLEWISHDPRNPDLNYENEQRSVASVNNLLKPEGVALISPFNQGSDYEVSNLEKNNFGISFSKK